MPSGELGASVASVVCERPGPYRLVSGRQELRLLRGELRRSARARCEGGRNLEALERLWFAEDVVREVADDQQRAAQRLYALQWRWRQNLGQWLRDRERVAPCGERSLNRTQNES